MIISNFVAEQNKQVFGNKTMRKTNKKIAKLPLLNISKIIRKKINEKHDKIRKTIDFNFISSTTLTIPTQISLKQFN